MLRMFCEADGAPSMRRILAFLCFLSFTALAVVAMSHQDGSWYAFIPSALSLAAMLLLMFFTTWSDVASVVSAAKGKKTGNE